MDSTPTRMNSGSPNEFGPSLIDTNRCPYRPLFVLSRAGHGTINSLGSKRGYTAFVLAMSRLQAASGIHAGTMGQGKMKGRRQSGRLGKGTPGICSCFRIFPAGCRYTLPKLARKAWDAAMRTGFERLPRNNRISESSCKRKFCGAV